MEIPDLLKEYFEPFAGQSGSCSSAEFSMLLTLLAEKTPCNFLIFGVGRDSPGWVKANEGGYTVFIEDNSEWINSFQPTVLNTEVIEVEYKAPRVRWRFLVEDHKDEHLSPSLALELPTRVKDCAWDFIIVDAPLGTVNHGPGRHSSIYTAKCLAGPKTIVAVHDCDREIEYTVAELLLRPRSKQAVELEKLRIYLPCAPNEAQE